MGVFQKRWLLDKKTLKYIFIECRQIFVRLRGTEETLWEPQDLPLMAMLPQEPKPSSTTTGMVVDDTHFHRLSQTGECAPEST